MKNPSTARRRSPILRSLAYAACIVGVVATMGCAHPISIEAKSVPQKSAVQSPKKVVYVMSAADRAKEVTTPGGGGDKISYFPYKDFERSLRAALSAHYADVSVVSSKTDANAVRQAGASLIFVPEITTTSSSPSPLTWPPTKFGLKLTLDVLDVLDGQATPVARLRVDGNGAAEWSEFKVEFGLAGRRAVEEAALALVADLGKNDTLK